MMLKPEEIDRYSRQILLTEIGPSGQLKLKTSSVLIVGCGGLGAGAALYLAAAGVGKIGLLDKDVVNRSNLHRQIIYAVKDIKQPKVTAAKEHLAKLNPLIELTSHNLDAESAKMSALVAEYDYVLDGSDNFTTKLRLNELCFALKKPLFFAGLRRWEAHISTFIPGKTGCLACLLGETKNRRNLCATEGILGSVAGMAGVIQSLEVIKLILDLPVFANRLMLLDCLDFATKLINLSQNPNCLVCAPS